MGTGAKGPLVAGADAHGESARGRDRQEPVGSGRVKVTKQGRLLNLLEAGECVGEMSYVKEGEIARQATVETMDDVLLAEFEAGGRRSGQPERRYQFLGALLHSLVEQYVL